MNLIAPKEFKLKFDSGQIQLLDIREHYEHEICSIGGLHIPMDEVSARIHELNQDLPVCVMCKSGKRAAALANFLVTDFNFSEVFVLDGGISAYAEQVDSSLEMYE